MNWSPPIRATAAGWIVLAAGLAALAMPVRAADDCAKIRAVLIWGTNDPKPENSKLKDLDPKTGRKLRAVFKWKDYYEVNRKEFAATKTGNEKVRLSEKCEIAVRDFGKSTVEVKLYGEGQLVVTKRQIMKPGELLVLAGEDKNDTAWFVAFTLAPEDGADGKP